MKRPQEKVADFIEEYNLDSKPEFRILDLAAEIGEIAADAAKSSDYGRNREDLSVKKDEIGDALFSLIAVAESLEIDAEEALDQAIAKYERRFEEKGDVSSGN